ncbi:MAG: LamG-like jellyroll fold domain-containing protein [Victivallales bacterium]
MKQICLLLISLLCLLAGTEWSYCANADDNSYANWRQFRDRLAQDKSLVRYYTFEEKGEAAANLAGGKIGTMMIASQEPYGKTDISLPHWTQGRFQGKSALGFRTRTDNVGGTRFYRTDSGVLTIEAWVRTHLNPGEKAEATLFSVGTGYESGWTLRNSNVFTQLRLGRPADKQGAVDLMVYKKLAGHVWHQLVGVIDRQNIRLYIDGELAGSRDFTGEFVQPMPPMLQNPDADAGGFKIGSGSWPGKNTLLFDCDEVAVYDRVLTPEEVRSHYEAGHPAESAAEQEAAHRALLEKETLIERIGLGISKESYGYFPTGKPVTISALIPADTKLEGTFKVEAELREFEGKTLFHGEKALKTSGQEDASLTWDLPLPEKRALYQIHLRLKDSQGALVIERAYTVATVVALTPMSDRPNSSPLGEAYPEDLSLGGRYRRLTMDYHPMNKDGVHNWEYMDSQVRESQELGVEILYCMKPYYEDQMPQKDHQQALNRIVQGDSSEWESWVRAVVERYRDRVKYWEIINEPNAISIKPEQYAALIKSAHRIIREADPQAKIVGLCGVSTPAEWTENVLAAGGGGYFDILSFHNYVDGSPIRGWKRDRWIERMRASLVKHLGEAGKTIPIWDSEWGAATMGRIKGHILNEKELSEYYPGGSTRKENGITICYIYGVNLVTEHTSACWSIQHVLLNCALGVERLFMLSSVARYIPGLLPGICGNGSPSERGVAFAAMASVMDRMRTTRLIPLASSTAAGVLVTSLEGKRTAALFADVPTTRSFIVGEGRTCKGMDFLGNPLEWETQGKVLTVAIGMEPIYIFDVPENFAEAPFLNVKNFPALVSPNEKVEGIVTVTNLLPTPLRGQLDISSPQSKLTMDKEINLEAGGVKDIRFQLEAGGLARGDHPLFAHLTRNDKDLAAMERSFSSEGVGHGVPMLDHPIKLDADPSDWQDVSAETADKVQNVVIGKPPVGYYDPNSWQGAKDLSFSVKTAWRPGDGLYFLLDVVDDKIKTVPQDKPGQAFLQDGLEFFFDGRDLKDQTPAYSFGAEQILLVPSVEDSLNPCVFANIAKYGKSVELEFVGKRTGTGYLIEGRVRPKEGGPFKLAPGVRLGMDFIIDDAADSDKMERKTQMALHGSAANCNDTSNFGRYQLLPEGRKLGANLIKNGNLTEDSGEDATKNDHGSVTGWVLRNEDVVKKLLDKEPGKIRWGLRDDDGKRALWISSSATVNAEPRWSQTVPAKEKTGYTVSCRMRYKVEGKVAWLAGRASAVFFDSKGTFLGHQAIGSADRDWGSYSGNVITPAGTASIGVWCGICCKMDGGTADFYWNDISVREMP